MSIGENINKAVCGGSEVYRALGEAQKALDVLQLLRGEVGVIEQPVKFLAVLVLGAHEVYGAVHKAEHFMALLDTLRLMFQLRAGEIRAGQIDGFKKFINAATVFDFELRFQLLYG